MIYDLDVPLNKEIQEMAYKGPTDSMSVTYGNGFNRCGPLRYNYKPLNGNQIVDVFSNEATHFINNQDDFFMRLASYNKGTTVTANATLTIDLEWYPSSTPAFLQVNMTYRECMPQDFSGPEVVVPEL